MQTEDLNSIKSDKIVDARGTSCPGPLLETKKAIVGGAMGGILETLSSDEGTRQDIPAWAKKTGQEFLGYISEPGYDRIFVKRLK
ncbi:MAG: sulfurtransferase TusA family protein [Nitrososphaerota archaeon]|nr:sulfurtransferase TusA family protein [Nitrososphaerota archaeon]